MLLTRAFSYVGGESFLLKKTERHYSGYRDKITSIFLIAMAASSAWTGRPKGALTQTAFAVRPGLRVPAPCAWGFPPLRPRPTVRRLDAGNVSPFHRDKGSRPAPLDPPPNRMPVGCAAGREPCPF